MVVIIFGMPKCSTQKSLSILNIQKAPWKGSVGALFNLPVGPGSLSVPGQQPRSCQRQLSRPAPNSSFQSVPEGKPWTQGPQSSGFQTPDAKGSTSQPSVFSASLAKLCIGKAKLIQKCAKHLAGVRTVVTHRLSRKLECGSPASHLPATEHASIPRNLGLLKGDPSSSSAVFIWKSLGLEYGA